jgi:hypothetical protein
MILCPTDDGPSDQLKFVERKIVDSKNCAVLYGNVSINAASLCISNVDLQGTCNVSFIIFYGHQFPHHLNVFNSLVYLVGVLHEMQSPPFD